MIRFPKYRAATETALQGRALVRFEIILRSAAPGPQWSLSRFNSAALQIITLMAFMAVGAGAVWGQPITRPFVFTLSASDTLQSPLLPPIEAGPAGGHGAWHLSPEGHFTAQDGTRGKFFGTEITWTSNFINSDQAIVLAKRLRKMGFNALRLNYFDYFGWDDASLFHYYQSGGVPDTSSYALNPLQLARFDTLLYVLKQEGIYVFLSMNSYHPFSYGEGVPDSLYPNGYLAHMIYPQCAWLEHQWARTLTSHINPLTGIALARDPSIACYEMLFEHSLPYYWQLKRLNYVDTLNALDRGLATISYQESRRLDTLWSIYLQRKYNSDAALNAAWSSNPSLDPYNRIPNGSFEDLNNSSWTLLPTNVQAKDITFSPGEEGTFAKLVHIGASTAVSPTAVLLYTYSTPVGFDSSFQLSFWSKIRPTGPQSLRTRQLYAVVSDQATNINSLVQMQTIDTTWREYRFPFRGQSAGPQLIGIYLSNDSGDVLLDNFTLKAIPEQGLRSGESLATVSVKRVPYDSLAMVPSARAADETMFYDSLQRSYYDGMMRLLRDTLSVAGLVNTSQGNYASSILDYHAFNSGEVTETHTGFDYVSSNAAGAYSDSQWVVRNTPMVLDNGFYSLGLAGASSILGKSFVLGEWTNPVANQYGSEQAIIPVTYAGYQDWDGIFFTPYASYREQLFADTMVYGYSAGWNNIVSDHALMAQMPMASFVFRNSLVAPGTIEDTIAHTDKDVFLFSHYPNRGLFAEENGDQAVITAMKVRERFGALVHSAPLYSRDYSYNMFTSYDSDAVRYISLDADMGTFRAVEPNVDAFTGFVTSPVIFPQLTIERLDHSNDILSMYYIFADSQKQGFLSISTRSQNSGVEWLDSTTYGGHHGHAPTIMSAANLRLTFLSDFDSVFLYPLDAQALPAGPPISAVREGTSSTFVATLDQQTTPSVWFIVRQSAASLAGVDMNPSSPALDISISPNPASSRASVLFTLPANGPVRFSLVDDLAREVWHADEDYSAGEHRISIPVATLLSGAYRLRMNTGSAVLEQDLSIIR